MNNNNHEEVIENEEISAPPAMKPGEKGFNIFLLLMGLFFLSESIKMYQVKPGASSYAAVPLFVSILIVVFSMITIISDIRKKTPTSVSVTKGQMFKNAILFIFPKDIVVILLLILLYCIGLYVGLGFYIVTPVFLWISMCYLMGEKFLHNILWTALSLAFIFVMFSTIFKVVLP
jgi:hypothetical protein